MGEYVPPNDDEIEALSKMETDVYGSGEGALTPKQITDKIFKDSGPNAAMTIAHLAKSASNENTRLKAATYIADRVLGPAGQANNNPDGNKEPLDELIGDFTAAIERDSR